MYEQMDITQFLYGVSLSDADFLMNDDQQIQYNEVCQECANTCKQSFRCSIVQCPYFTTSRKGRARKIAAQG